MKIHGSLHGYILSDVISLIVRQKATGTLDLVSDRKEGTLFFRNGMIAGAFNNEEVLSEKLFFLLSDTCHYPLSEAAHLFSDFKDDITGLCDEIARRNILSEQAIKTFSTSVVEDIACRFFLWKKGYYHFTPEMSAKAAANCPEWLELPSENLSMEAVRRFDEWRRIKLNIDPDAVYAPTQSQVPAHPVNLHLHLSTTDLVLSRIDGVSPVSAIIRTSSLTSFKTYEAIKSLLTEARIRPIEHRSFRPFARPRSGSERRKEKTTLSGRALSAVFSMVGAMLLVVFLGRFVLHGLALSSLENRASRVQLEIPVAEAMQKIECAEFLFDGFQGSLPSMANLRNAGLLTSADLSPMVESGMFRKPSPFKHSMP